VLLIALNAHAKVTTRQLVFYQTIRSNSLKRMVETVPTERFEPMSEEQKRLIAEFIETLKLELSKEGKGSLESFRTILTVKGEHYTVKIEHLEPRPKP